MGNHIKVPHDTHQLFPFDLILSTDFDVLFENLNWNFWPQFVLFWCFGQLKRFSVKNLTKIFPIT